MRNSGALKPRPENAAAVHQERDERHDGPRLMELNRLSCPRNVPRIRPFGCVTNKGALSRLLIIRRSIFAPRPLAPGVCVRRAEFNAERRRIYGVARSRLHALGGVPTGRRAKTVPGIPRLGAESEKKN
ncbi:hypothetical protein AAFF_G00044100 [Aldrovandia affinis]|uniref:Uncharacterized protein n=1 Tax=Aldrovandia affinis TaxID=143900 RepID=A0AAD7S285_9TELE|nr:hypothetical protein AAFF_G00044100 [Aldrovandia affinis]